MYPLLESIKIKSGFAFHLSLHQERMNRSCLELFGSDCGVDLFDFLHALDLPGAGLYKCRLCYDVGDFKSDVQLYNPKKITSLKLIEKNDMMYAHKFTDRSAIDDLVKLKGDADEIIIVKNGLITDASYANLIFWNGVDWYTPSKPLFKGIQREYLLKQGAIKLADIKVADLRNYSKLALINALLDFEDKIEVPIENIS